MQALYAPGLQPARLARIRRAYYFGPQAMQVGGVLNEVSKLTLRCVARVQLFLQKAASVLVAYWGLCTQHVFGSDEMVRIWWEKIIDWETRRYVAILAFICSFSNRFCTYVSVN